MLLLTLLELTQQIVCVVFCVFTNIYLFLACYFRLQVKDQSDGPSPVNLDTPPKNTQNSTNKTFKPSPTLLAVQEDSKQSKNVKQTGFEKETRPGEEVKYEGYSNPSKQSRSFRLLESNLGEAEVSAVTGNTGKTSRRRHTIRKYTQIITHFFFFFLNFCWTHVHFWGHRYPCFGLLVTSPLGFKSRVGSALFELCRGVCDKRSLRFTSAGVYSQHSRQSLSPHACFSRGGMPDLNHRPPAWQADALTTRPQ